MIIIALDPGYDRCGVAVIERRKGEKELLLESFCSLTNRKDLFEKRLVQIAKEFRKTITKFSPDVCVLETLFFTSNQKTVMHVAEARGALILVASEMGIPVREFTPKQVKIAVTGDGNATKKQMTLMVPKLIHIEKTIQFDDEYDAIAVGLTASAIFSSVAGIENYPQT